MGLKLNGRYVSLVLAVQLASLVQAVRAAGKCDAVFKGFSDCVLKMGHNIANYPQDLDDKKNLETICRYWDDFHACTLIALTDCQQEGVADVWEKLKEKSKKLDYEGNLFVLCGKSKGASSSVAGLASLGGLALALSAALATWLAF
ncbi:neuritin [Sceloporus undulatus]|uniref:neuritin n=1 Tax=Sceloporus undulatus TaxID=8520 RepID=UPI001C4CAEAD|nr:neuritin [Sceloporus undulatus]